MRLLALVLVAVCLTSLPAASYEPASSPLTYLPVVNRSDELEPRAYIPLVGRSELPQLPNSGFEGGEGNSAVWWDWPDPEAHATGYIEVRPPVGWTAWWVEGRPCAYINQYHTGRPEVLVFESYVDPRRVYDGNKALKWFTFWRCSLGGIYAEVTLPAGTFAVDAMMHSWFSDCSSDPYGPPRDQACQPIMDPNVWARLSIGIELAPNVPDWSSDRVVWSLPATRYGVYSQPVLSMPFILRNAGPVRIWLKMETSLPLKHNDLYADQVIIRRIE